MALIATLSTPAAVRASLNHLRATDPVMRQLIDQVGGFGLKLERRRFYMLARSIVWQQISTAAARSIWRRLELLAGRISPETIVPLTPDQLRTAGISAQKAAYLLDLARKVLDGEVRLEGLPKLDDDEIVQELVKVKGIGVWTAQMFLIFSLGRLDIFPHADLGIRTALRNLYGLNELPDKERSHEIAKTWRPYATVASWYCWRSLDLENSAIPVAKSAA